jgi:predicted lipoprotein with Yx(FWY)xxD motif
MHKQQSLFGLAALLGLIATQACSSDSTPSGEASAGIGGEVSAAGTSSTAGTSASQAGTSAGVSGSAGSPGASGSTSSGGTGGTGGTGGASGGGGTSTGGASGSGGSGGAAASTFTVHTTSKGDVVATAAGITLYVYQPDTPAAGQTPATSACTGTCLTHWPLYYGNPVSVPAALTASDFGSFDRGGGVMQSTYHGWPVYMYDDDAGMPGSIKGDLEKNTMGKVVWYALTIPFTAPPKP